MGTIKHTPVANSSNVQSYGYDAESQTLEVKFKNGANYRYPRVSQAEFDALKQAPSVGAHVSAHFARKGREFQKQQADGSWS